MMIENLQIYQLNMNKSLSAQLELLNSINPDTTDLILIEEPYIDHFNRSCASTHWTIVYPTKHLNSVERTRSIILVNKKISTNS